MTLSERLERAKRERLMAAGLLHSENALKPEGEVDVTDGNASFQYDDIKIEVKSAGLHAVGPPVERSESMDPPGPRR